MGPGAAFLIWLVFLAAAWASVDPAPPKVEPPPGGAAKSPEAMEHPGLTSHAKPRPLEAGSVTEEWASFLGPTYNMTTRETPLLADLAAANRVWEVRKGSGYAAPAVHEDRLILFHRLDREEVVECLHPETGRRYWRFAYPTAYQDRYGYSDGPRASPVIDPDAKSPRVYVYGAEGKLHCLDLRTGHCYWKRDLLAEFKVQQNFFGVGATPLLEGELLIINVGADGGPCVAAFDKATGKMAWGSGQEWGPSYASPVPATVHGKRRVLVFAGGESDPPTGGLLCIDPVNGAVDFTFPHRGNRRESVNASSPLVVEGNKVFISECYGRGGVLVEITPEMKAKELWRTDRLGTHFMTAIHRDGHLYGFDGHGPLDCPLVCVSVKTGEEVWRQEPRWAEEVDTPQGKLRRNFGLNRSFLLHAGERTLCLTETGHLLWLELNPKGYKELARTRLFSATETWTPPVIRSGLLYVCQNNPDLFDRTPPRLLCFDLRGR